MNAPVPLLDRATPAAHLVFEQLHEAILSLEMPPGTEVSRAELQKRFGVSSTPVRDALMRLEELGLIDVFPQSGTIVSRIDVPGARQAQFLRQAIELETVRRLALSPDAGLMRRLRIIINEQRHLAKAGNLKAFNAADLAFHKSLYDAADVPDLWALVRRQSGHIDRIRRLHLPIGRKAAEIVRDHRAIVEAIASGEPERAQTALRDHLSHSLAFSAELRLRFPDYFNE